MVGLAGKVALADIIVWTANRASYLGFQPGRFIFRSDKKITILYYTLLIYYTYFSWICNSK